MVQDRGVLGFFIFQFFAVVFSSLCVRFLMLQQYLQAILVSIGDVRTAEQFGTLPFLKLAWEGEIQRGDRNGKGDRDGKEEGDGVGYGDGERDCLYGDGERQKQLKEDGNNAV